MTSARSTGAGSPSTAGPLRVAVQRLDPGLPLPGYANPLDAGLDLLARTEVLLVPGARALVPTGVALVIPAGFVGLVHPRSGLAARHGVTVLNAPGTVDAGYRGEIMVNLINLDAAKAFQVNRGDRIAQLLVQAVSQVELVETESLPPSVRGQTGHGSTGGFGSS